MAIQNLPVWTFEPNWSTPVTETLQWLTDILSSPSGAEQRRSLRVNPRSTLEYSILVQESERALFDNLLVTYGARTWYLPVWHDVNLLEQDAPIGSTSFLCSGAATGDMRYGGVLCFMGESAFEYELIELYTRPVGGFTTVTASTRAWPAGTRVFPLATAWFTDQPAPVKQSSSTFSAELRFQLLTSAVKTAVWPPEFADIYNGFRVLSQAPDEREKLSSGYDRMLVELDNSTSVPMRYDTAARGFSTQKYTWVLEGRDSKNRFDSLLRVLRGRAQPLWVPTFMDDFILASPIIAGTQTISVEGAGFTTAGGPRWDRSNIIIQTSSGPIYRSITGSALQSDGRETIALGAAFGSNVSLEEIEGISFMTLMRLNQDSVVIEHLTDTEGAARANAVFRSAPNLRIPQPGF